MNRDEIKETVKRRLYAESMGRCMNPKCKRELFIGNGDIIEKAHIDSYSDSKDNSFENLIILCPVCHKIYDKTNMLSSDTIREWKKIRHHEIEKIFSKKFKTFKQLQGQIKPLLEENQRIYENYFLNENKKLWDKFEPQILINNKKIKKLLNNNLNLIQNHKYKEYSNREYVDKYLMHIDEFETTRQDDEKIRQVLFPAEINSIFGVDPVECDLLSLTESLEELITVLQGQGYQVKIYLGIDKPYIEFVINGTEEKLYLGDTPRLRQVLYNYKCFKRSKVRFQNLNFALKYIIGHGLNFKFPIYNNLRKIIIKDKINMLFVYEYCLSKVFLVETCNFYDDNKVIVNLHNWNGSSCISCEAYEWAKQHGVVLLDMDNFYDFVKKIK